MGQYGPTFALLAYFFSQVIFESPSFDQLFSLSSIEALCKFQSDADKLFEPIRSAIGFPNSWSLPSYVACMSGLQSCSEITGKNVQDAATLIRSCAPHRDLIIPCGLPTESLRAWRRESHNCSSIPPECTSKFISGLFYYILSNNIGTDREPVFTNVILPALQWVAYEDLGTPNVTSDIMLQISYEMEELAGSVTQLKAKGINLGVKNVAFHEIFYQDCFYVLAAWILVYFVIWLYSGSLFFTLAVLLSVVLSMGVSYFVYRLVFRLQFFPFMNLLMVILLIGIGADDTFVLKVRSLFNFGRVSFTPRIGEGADTLPGRVGEAMVRGRLRDLLCLPG